MNSCILFDFVITHYICSPCHCSSVISTSSNFGKASRRFYCYLNFAYRAQKVEIGLLQEAFRQSFYCLVVSGSGTKHNYQSKKGTSCHLLMGCRACMQIYTTAPLLQHKFTLRSCHRSTQHPKLYGSGWMKDIINASPTNYTAVLYHLELLSNRPKRKLYTYWNYSRSKEFYVY